MNPLRSWLKRIGRTAVFACAVLAVPATADVPAGWTQESRFGVSFAIPPEFGEWADFDSRFEAGIETDEPRRMAMFRVAPTDPARFEREMEEVRGAGMAITPGDAVVLGGVSFARNDFAGTLTNPDDPSDSITIEGVAMLSQVAGRSGSHVEIVLLTINLPAAELAPLRDGFLAGLALDGTADGIGALPPERLLGGLFTIELPPGLSVSSWGPGGGEASVYAFNTAVRLPNYRNPYFFELSIQSGLAGSSHLRMLDGGTSFEGPWTVVRGSFAGLPALIAEGRARRNLDGSRASDSAEWPAAGYGIAPDLCDAEGRPVMLFLRADADWLAEFGGVEALLGLLERQPVEGYGPCPAGTFDRLAAQLR